jgi:hypothetical protein
MPGKLSDLVRETGMTHASILAVCRERGIYYEYFGPAVFIGREDWAALRSHLIAHHVPRLGRPGEQRAGRPRKRPAPIGQ